MDQNLTRAEENLLKALCTTKNRDGFFEILMSDYVYVLDKDNFQAFFENFNDDKVIKYIDAIYSESKSLAEFRERMWSLAQLSIQSKVTSGSATYYFIKNVAFVTDTSWLKSMMQNEPSKRVQTLYFFKKIENCLDKKIRAKEKVLKEYNEYAKKPSKYINKLLSADGMTAFITEDTELCIIKELKKSL